MRINCRNDVGDTGYNIPYNVEEDKITFNDFGKSTCIIAIETGGMFDRLVENGFDETHEAIFGPHQRTTCKIHKEIFTKNASSFGFASFTVYRCRSLVLQDLQFGSVWCNQNSSYFSYFSYANYRYLGVTPSDIINYELPADELSDRDKSALKSILTDPRFKSKYWRSEIELQLEINRKAEQQALAKYGLDFVTNTYLPEKLKEMNW